jgi:hypothetical protein
MSLVFTVTYLGSVPIALHPYYVKTDDGRWKLDVSTTPLETALQKERDANHELKKLGITPGDIAAIKAGADLHHEFQALLQQFTCLSEMDKSAMASERDKALAELNESKAKLALASEFIRVGGNHAAIELILPRYASRIRYEPNGEWKSSTRP